MYIQSFAIDNVQVIPIPVNESSLTGNGLGKFVGDIYEADFTQGSDGWQGFGVAPLQCAAGQLGFALGCSGL